MIVNGNELSELPSSEILIIGTGPAGLALATRLASNGTSVLLIEAGGLSPSEESQRLYEGESTGIKYPLAASRIRAFGGSSNCWAGWCRRLESIEFSRRHWIENSDWPIDHNEIVKFYSDASSFLGIEGANYDPYYWAERCNRVKASIFDGAVNFEPRVWQLALDKRLGRDLKNEIENSKKITLVHNCCAIELIANGSLVRSVRCRSTSGKLLQAVSNRFVLAMGALENARILMASGLQDRVGSRWLGKGFMEHPARINGLRLYSYFNSESFMEFGGGNTFQPPGEKFKVAFGFGATSKFQSNAGILGFWGVFSDRIVNLQRDEISKASHLLSSYGIKPAGELVAYDITWAIEQAPAFDSALEIGSVKDEVGINKIKLNWVVSSLDVNSVIYSHRSLADDLIKRRVGALRRIKGFSRSDSDIDYGHHHIGTVRMGNSARDGVVDGNCRLFGFENIFCAGSGIFPTSGVTNPTLALTALAFRLAEHLNS
jgi:hypothetical protein